MPVSWVKTDFELKMHRDIASGPCWLFYARQQCLYVDITGGKT